MPKPCLAISQKRSRFRLDKVVWAVNGRGQAMSPGVLLSFLSIVLHGWLGLTGESWGGWGGGVLIKFDPLAAHNSGQGKTF